MNNKELIHKFYTALSNGNSSEMIACYHENITFRDPVFGVLKGPRACSMWEMLLSRKTSDAKFSLDNIEASSETGKAHWHAEYFYGKRKVINMVRAEFKFKDGRIIEHIDTFDLWKWTRQALGITGYTLGWTPFLKQKMQNTVNKKLDRFVEKNKEK